MSWNNGQFLIDTKNGRFSISTQLPFSWVIPRRHNVQQGFYRDCLQKSLTKCNFLCVTFHLTFSINSLEAGTLASWAPQSDSSLTFSRISQQILGRGAQIPDCWFLAVPSLQDVTKITQFHPQTNCHPLCQCNAMAWNSQL